MTAAWVAAMRGLGTFLPVSLRLVDDPFGLRFAGALRAMRDRARFELPARVASRLWLRGRLREFVLYMQIRTRVIDDDVSAFAHAGVSSDDPAVRRAVGWLTVCQNADGGWGESNDSYAPQRRASGETASTPHQSAWAVLALIAAGEAQSDVVRRGVEYLLRTQQAQGLWSDPGFTAPGFPRVFYLRYHGYCGYFPLWALAAYRSRLRHGNLH